MESRRSVLVVDDDPEVRETGVTALEREIDDVDVLREDSAEAALSRLDEELVDCVVSEYRLAGLDGLTFLERLRERGLTCPFVLFTAEESEAVAREAIDSGVTDYVRKGGRCQYVVLANRVQNAIERRRAERDLEEERRRYELVGRASGEAFWDWDMETDHVERSDGYARTFGFEPDEVEPDADWWVDQVHPEDEETVSRVANRAMERGDERYEVDYRVRTGDGSYKPVRTSAYVVYDEDDEPVRIVGAVSDISDLVRKNERLEKFASIVSHDLRNPLNVLQGRLELAAETGDPEHFEECRRAIDRMEGLIDDLLELACQGETIDETEPVALPTLARDCWDAVETGPAALTVDADCTVRADPGRLQQLFENLYRNSVEHGSTSPDSQVRRDALGDTSDEPSVADAPEDAREPALRVTVGELPDDSGFFVADDGPGIPDAERDRVFDSGYSTASDGSGLGLAIVDDIVRAHGWSVSVTESRDGGARFEFTDVDVVD